MSSGVRQALQLSLLCLPVSLYEWWVLVASYLSMTPLSHCPSSMIRIERWMPLVETTLICRLNTYNFESMDSW